MKKKQSTPVQEGAITLPPINKVVRIKPGEQERMSGTELFSEIAMIFEAGFAVTDDYGDHSIVSRVWEASPGGLVLYQSCEIEFTTGQKVVITCQRPQQGRSRGASK